MLHGGGAALRRALRQPALEVDERAIRSGWAQALRGHAGPEDGPEDGTEDGPEDGPEARPEDGQEDERGATTSTTDGRQGPSSQRGGGPRREE
jgi:hypothetical protein